MKKKGLIWLSQYIIVNEDFIKALNDIIRFDNIRFDLARLVDVEIDENGKRWLEMGGLKTEDAMRIYDSLARVLILVFQNLNH